MGAPGFFERLMDYRKFLSKTETVVLPYLGGPRVDAETRRLRVQTESEHPCKRTNPYCDHKHDCHDDRFHRAKCVQEVARDRVNHKTNRKRILGACTNRQHRPKQRSHENGYPERVAWATDLIQPFHQLANQAENGRTSSRSQNNIE